MLSLAIFLVACLLVSLSFCEVVFRFALSLLPGGVQLFCFPLAPFQSVLLVLSRALVGLPGSLLCLQPGYRSSSFQFTVVWLVLRLPSLQPYTRPLFGLLAVPQFLLSGSRRCVFSLTLGFSVPLPVSSSWAPLSRFSSSAASSSPGYSLWLLDPAFVLLLGASSYSLLAACLLFLFLGTCSRPSVVPGFSLLFSWPSYQPASDLFWSGAVSGLLVLSAAGVPGSLFPLRCFAFDHVVPVPFCSKVSSGLDGSSSVLFGGVPPSPPVHRPSLGWPTRSISLLRLSLLVCSWGLCSPSFPPSRLWSSRLALSFCRRAPGLLFASGSVFLPSLPSWSVGSPGSPRLGCPCVRGGSSQGCPCSVSSVCLGSAPFLPSSPAPPVSYGLAVVLSPRWDPPLRVYWLSHPTMVHCDFVICCLSSV